MEFDYVDIKDRLAKGQKLRTVILSQYEIDDFDANGINCQLTKDGVYYLELK